MLFNYTITNAASTIRLNYQPLHAIKPLLLAYLLSSTECYRLSFFDGFQ